MPQERKTIKNISEYLRGYLFNFARLSSFTVDLPEGATGNRLMQQFCSNAPLLCLYSGELAPAHSAIREQYFSFLIKLYPRTVNGHRLR